METLDLKQVELARDFPAMLLKYLQELEEIQLAAFICNTGQIRLNVNDGTIQSIEFRQYSRKRKNNGGLTDSD